MFFFVLLILFLGMMTTTVVYGDSYTCSDVTTGTPTASQTQTCSSGTLQNGSAGELCPFSQTPCVQQTSIPSCPSGYNWNGSSCVSTVSASCPGGYTWNGSTCTETTTTTISACSSGHWNGSQCVTTETKNWTCPYRSLWYECGGSPDRCRGSGTTSSLERYDCSANVTVYYSPSCPSGYYYIGNGECATTTTLTASPTCPSGYTLSGNTCTATTSATCPSGTTLINGECVSPWTCPVSGNGGDSATCIEPSGSSSYYCSPYSCYTDSSGTNVSTTPVNATMPPTQTNNGTVTDSGCDGSVYLFPGTAMQCRSGGEQTAWQDCCNASTYLFGMLKCTTQEESVAKDLQYDTQYGANGYNNPNSYGGSGDAQYVGSYCSDKFFGLCLENMKVYCVFHSLLGLIIQEQGRAQLGIGFGSPQNPDCSGLTPTQFQELNFSNFDFTEYVTVLENKIKAGVINTNTLNQIQNYTTTITNQISNYENELSGVNP